MGDVKEFDTNAILCKICKKRKSTVLCDAIIGEMAYAGHPPKINGIIDLSIPMRSPITCDTPMCDKCTTKITDHMDLCPDHAKKLK